MRGVIALMSAAALAACGSQAKSDESASMASDTAPAREAPPAAATTPDLATCPARDPVDEGLRQRTAPIPVPGALREIMRSDMDDFAFSTLGGTSVCVEASWMESIRDAALSADERFASFGWDGYESYGHVIVDRTGRGQAIDTGVAPAASPSGRLLAAVDLSESGFGALNAFAVWRIDASGTHRLASQEDALEATDWRIEGWAGEKCVNLTALPWAGYTGEEGAPREPFRARESGGWRLEPGRCAEA